MRADEIARLTGVSLRTVRRWISEGKLPSAKIAGVRLVAKKAVLQMLAPAMREWDENDPENEDNTDPQDSIGRSSPK
nr:helix-turn-helix domain-containing protein [Candidatus Rhodoblastus alkanivorans]